AVVIGEESSCRLGNVRNPFIETRANSINWPSRNQRAEGLPAWIAQFATRDRRFDDNWNIGIDLMDTIRNGLGSCNAIRTCHSNHFTGLEYVANKVCDPAQVILIVARGNNVAFLGKEFVTDLYFEAAIKAR